MHTHAKESGRYRDPWHLTSILVLAVSTTVVAGCSKDGPSMLQHFVQTQAETQTPDGPVMIETVVLNGEYIEYETEGGTRWRVRRMDHVRGSGR